MVTEPVAPSSRTLPCLPSRLAHHVRIALAALLFLACSTCSTGAVLGVLERVSATPASRALTKSISITNAAATELAYSTSVKHAGAVCVNTTTGTNLFVVEESAANTTDGVGPYCDTCVAGPVFTIGRAWARLSAGGPATVRCAFYEEPPSGALSSFAGLTRGAADTLYLLLDGSNDPMTGRLDVLTQASCAATSIGGTATSGLALDSATGQVRVCFGGNAVATFNATQILGGSGFNFTSAGAGGFVSSGTGNYSFSGGGATKDFQCASNDSCTVQSQGTGDLTLESGGDDMLLNDGAGDRGKITLASGIVDFIGGSAGGASDAQYRQCSVGTCSFGPNQIGTRSDEAVSSLVAAIVDNLAGTPNNLLRVFGTGIVQMSTGVTANNNLAGTSACAAAGDVGKEVLYSDTGSSRITRCVCEQTAAATFAWGAITASGDCT